MNYTVVVQKETGLTQFYAKVFQIMAIGLLITAGVSLYISHSEGLMASLFHLTETMEDGEMVKSYSASGWWYFAAFIELALVLWMTWRGISPKYSLTGTFLLFVVYAALNGVTLSPVLFAYTETSIAKVFFITAGMFGGCAFYGTFTKRNLLPLQTFFLAGLIGLIILLVVNMFLASPAFDMAVSAVAILLFAGLTAFDMQKLREMYYDSMGSSRGLAVYGALTLYLDFINMFLHILRFFGVKKD